VDKPIVPVPFDAELVPILEFMRSVMPTTHIDRDAIFKLRELQAPLRPSLEALTRDGAYTVEEVFASGTAENGATEVELLVCRPAGEIRACLYFVHGGGMVMGDNRSNADGVLDLLKGEGIMLVSVEHCLAPEFPHPSRSRTPTRASPGPRATRPSSATPRAALSSRVPARAAASPRR
jgi:acetyl esterase/lipase